METSQEKYRKIKEFGLNQGLPEIPDNLLSRLEEAYNRYLQFAGILTDNVNEKQIEEEREKYKYLYSGLRDGFPIFHEQNCVKYMNLVSGISQKYCAIYMYLDYVENVASGLLEQPPATWQELIEHQLYLTNKIIEEEKEIQQKTFLKNLEFKKIKSQQSSKSYKSILGTTGSGKSIVMFPYAAKENQIKITYKETDD